MRKKLLNIIGGVLGLAASLLPMKSADSENFRLDNLGAPENNIGGSIVRYEHLNGADENYDTIDVPWSQAPPNPYPKWLKSHTEPYVVKLKEDARPLSSDTTFQAKLSVVDTIGGGVTCPNKLYFEFLDVADPNRVYLTKIHCDGAYTPTGQPFDTIENIRDVITNGGFVDLPGVKNVPNRQVYGTCDVSCKIVKNPVVKRVIFNEGTGDLEYTIEATPGSIVNVYENIGGRNPTQYNLNPLSISEEVPITETNFGQDYDEITITIPPTVSGINESSVRKKFFVFGAVPKIYDSFASPAPPSNLEATSSTSSLELLKNPTYKELREDLLRIKQRIGNVYRGSDAGNVHKK